MSHTDVVRRWRVYREIEELPYPIPPYHKRMGTGGHAQDISEALPFEEQWTKQNQLRLGLGDAVLKERERFCGEVVACQRKSPAEAGLNIDLEPC